MNSIVEIAKLLKRSGLISANISHPDDNHEAVFLTELKVWVVVSPWCRLQELRASVVFQDHDLLNCKGKNDTHDQNAQASTWCTAKAWAALMEIEGQRLAKLVELQHSLRFQAWRTLTFRWDIDRIASHLSVDVQIGWRTSSILPRCPILHFFYLSLTILLF